MADYRKLLVWQNAHAMALSVEQAVRGMRSPHQISLRSQIVRSALSVPTNIVEGRTRQFQAEFARFLRISLNSSNELDYHLLVAAELGCIPPSEYEVLRIRVEEVANMLQGLIARIEADRAERDSAVHS